jgi:hypothetical protein
VDDTEEVSVYDLVEVGDVGPGAAEADAGVAGVEREEVDFPFVILDYVVVKQAIEKK